MGMRKLHRDKAHSDKTHRHKALGPTGRRRFLAGASALAGVAALGFPAVVGRAAEPLKVGTYGGYFKDSFDKHIYPDFIKETGIEIESIAEPTGEAWLVQLETAARAGVAPADVSMMAQVAMLKGQSSRLWTPLDLGQLPNAENLLPQFVHRYPDGKVDGIGAVAWYITLVSNTEAYPEAPASWAEFWDPKNKGKLGLLALASNSFLLEITAKTFFGGTEFLNTEENILKALDKLAELKANVALWYRDEGQFQQALQSGEIPMGQYYHDVAGLAAAEGHPVRSTFPKEGGVNDSGCWAVSRRVQAGGRRAGLHRLHVPSGHPGQAGAQGRHRAHGPPRAHRSDRCRVRRGLQRDRADHSALRPLPGQVRLAEPEVDRAGHRLISPRPGASFAPRAASAFP